MITDNAENDRSPRIVLVETSHPGNIGACARAMKTMGLNDLVLVSPQTFPHADATARASGADDLLARAIVVPTLEEALANCEIVIGVSARRRGISSPEVGPREAIGIIAQAAPRARAALVFGRERSGLTNDELDRCQWLARISANPDFGSLNLAAAVQIFAYEWRLGALSSETAPAPEETPLKDKRFAERLAPGDDVERFYRHLQETLIAIGFLNPENPRHLMRRLRRLFNRIGLERREVNILRGILTAVQQSIGRD